MVVVERADRVFETGQDVVANNRAASDDLHGTVGVAAPGGSVGQVNPDGGRASCIDDRVDSCAAVQVILARPADDRVVAAFAIQDVAVVAAIQQVVAITAVEIVAAALAAGTAES